MAHKRSAIKKHKQSEKRRMRNKAIKSTVKTLVKKAKSFIAAGEKEKASEIIRLAYSKIDKAAEKGVFHKNNAARKKSRLMKVFNSTFAKTA